tara:strand:- start:1929 stop:3299 length:1371 start_codon:yes stop_codon:yes gene_type:complete
MLKNNYDLFFGIFLISHLVVWTLIPTLSNINLPLDTIEALAWGSNLSWGYYKHPPASAFFVELVYQIFGNRDWAYYLLSQIFVIIAFFYVWKLSKIFLKKESLCLISVLLLEAIFFYNFTTPEFNVNVCQLPFWSMTIYYGWKCYDRNKVFDWILLGIVAAIGFLSKYVFVYLILSLKIFFIYNIFKKKKFEIKYFIPSAIFLLIISPHVLWLLENEFVTITYALNRSGVEAVSFIEYFANPFKFILKQLGILFPFLILFILIVKRFKLNFSVKKDKKKLFIILLTILPIVLVLLTSIATGAKIRTMWMTPFYLFFGVLLIMITAVKIKDNLKFFFSLFVLVFFLSPASYLYVSLANDFKRTDYPGKEISNLVQRKWEKNFFNEISIVVGDEWFAGNLSYHLSSRPKWFNTIENNLEIVDYNTGVIYTGNPKILKKSCPGVFGTIKPVGYCMIGVK